MVPENGKINDKDLHKTFLQVSQRIVELKIYIISLIPSDSRYGRLGLSIYMELLRHIFKKHLFKYVSLIS